MASTLGLIAWLTAPVPVRSQPATEDAAPLTAAALVQAIESAQPDITVAQLRTWGEADEPAIAWLQSTDNRNRPRQILVDRYSGTELAAPAVSVWQHAGRWLEQAAQVLFARPALLAGMLVLGYVAAALSLLRRARQSVQPPDPQANDPAATVLVVWASQTGNAEALARHSHTALVDGGVAAVLRPLHAVTAAELAAASRALFVVSTYGEGDPPDQATRFVRQVMGAAPVLGDLRFGMLALGDREYSQFCGFGHALERWLRTCGAHALFDLVEVDAGDPAALRHWQSLLAALGAEAGTDWAAPSYQDWQLRARECINAGSPGNPVFRIALRPADQTVLAHWQAGDIAEIGPRHCAQRVRDWMLQHRQDDRSVAHDGRVSLLSDLLATRQLPAAGDLAADDWIAALQPLPHREYSIASVPAEGQLELLVRQHTDARGQLGLGSGWLTAHASAGATIALRIRSNTAFHPPPPEQPLILIGNGTGLAGLRAHVAARPPGTRNWLLYGERSPAHDLHYRDELLAWQHSGHLAQLDLAFSRDGACKAYVQDLLPAQSTRLLQWVADGAAIFVCGSLQGMAPAVDDALARILGRGVLDQLTDSQRYRRDVY